MSPPPGALTQEPIPPSARTDCALCGARLYPPYRFCPACGEHQATPEEPVLVMPWRAAAIILAVIGVLAILIRL